MQSVQLLTLFFGTLKLIYFPNGQISSNLNNIFLLHALLLYVIQTQHQYTRTYIADNDSYCSQHVTRTHRNCQHTD